MRSSLRILMIAVALSACATPEESEVAALEKELGLDVAPYFPKCLSEEVSPRAAVRGGDYSVAHTMDNPKGHVAIDRCARWETDEPTGSKKNKPKKLVLKPQEEAALPTEDIIDR